MSGFDGLEMDLFIQNDNSAMGHQFYAFCDEVAAGLDPGLLSGIDARCRQQCLEANLGDLVALISANPPWISILSHHKQTGSLGFITGRNYVTGPIATGG